LSEAAKFPSGEAVRPDRVVIAGNSNAKPYRGLTRINADQGGSAGVLGCELVCLIAHTLRWLSVVAMGSLHAETL
jgi:hypothetical protein